MADSRFIEAGGLSIHYLEAGSGIPLVLLHGGMATAEMSWTTSMPELAHTYRVLAPDSRGHGQTNNPAGELGYAQMADDVLAFIEALGLDRPVLIGYSDGGQIALEFGIRHPGKSRALVFGGTIMGMTPQYLAGLKSWGFTEPGKVDLATLQQAFGDFYDEARRAHADFDHFLVALSRLWLTVPEYSDAQLASIAEPVLVACGDRDDLGPMEHAPRFLRLIPKAELAVVPNQTHGAASNPLFWAAVRDFLGRHVG